MTPGLHVVCRGPSAGGKTTAIKLITGLPAPAWPADPTAPAWGKTVATRAPEPRDHPEEYHWLSVEEFEAQWAAGLILERTRYAGNHQPYGIYRSDLEAGRDRRGPVFWVLDGPGAQFLRDYYGPGRVRTILFTADPEVLRQRMQRRGDDPLKVGSRLASYRTETEVDCDHRVDTTWLAPVEVALVVRNFVGLGG